MEVIFSSLITATVSIIICVVNNIVQNDKTRSLIEYRLEKLEKKQDDISELTKRTYKLEQDVAVMQQIIKNETVQ